LYLSIYSWSPSWFYARWVPWALNFGWMVSIQGVPDGNKPCSPTLLTIHFCFHVLVCHVSVSQTRGMMDR
jgi:hypothetical protein